jgi:hypothetical protein
MHVSPQDDSSTIGVRCGLPQADRTTYSAIRNSAAEIIVGRILAVSTGLPDIFDYQRNEKPEASFMCDRDRPNANAANQNGSGSAL